MSDLLSRPQTRFEKWFGGTLQSIQACFEMASPRLADEFAAFLIKSIPGFHLRSDFRSLIYVPEPPELVKIPTSVRTPNEICQWAEFGGLRVPPTERLATISVRENLVCCVAAHICFDGASLLVLMDQFRRRDLHPAPRFPNAIDATLANELAQPLDTKEHAAGMNGLSTLLWEAPLIRKWKDEARQECVRIEVPSPSLQCWNPKTEKFKNLTDALWRSGILAAKAIQPDLNRYGCSTWHNMRPHIKSEAIGNLIAPFTLIAKNVSEEMTISQFDQALRDDFKDKMKREYYVAALKATLDGMPLAKTPTAFFDVSNVGYFELSGPFVGFWAQGTIPARNCTAAVPLAAITLVDKKNPRFTLRYAYSQLVFTRSQAVRTFKAIVHSLQNIKPEMKVRDALRELREVAK
jgi:hypothetical protein